MLDSPCLLPSARQITLSDFLTGDEIERARRMSRDRVLREIIEPNIDRINQQLGQENDPRYLAYAVEYVMRAAGEWT